MYGAVEIVPERRGAGRGSLRATGVVLLGVCALAALAAGLYGVSAPAELLMPKRFRGKSMVQVQGFDGRPVTVPPANKLNFGQGTLSSYQGEFSRSTKGTKTQSLAAAAAKHGLSTKAANSDVDSYFVKEQRLAAQPQKARVMPKQEAAPVGKAPKFGESGSAARQEVKGYFTAEQRLAAEKQHPVLHQARTAHHHAAERAPKFGMSAASAAHAMSSFFDDQAAIAARKRTATKVHVQAPPAAVMHDKKGPAHGMSTTAADKDVDTYFAQQQKLAAQKRHPAKQSKQKAAPKGKAPVIGLSASAALRDVEGYFAKEMRLAEASMQQKSLQKKMLEPKQHSQEHEEHDQVKEEAHKEEEKKEESRKEEEEKEEAKHAAEEAKEHEEAKEKEEKEMEADEAQERKEEEEEEQEEHADDGEEAAEEEADAGEEADEEHATFNPDELGHPAREVDHIGEIPVDKTLDAPLWSRDDSTLPDRMVPAEKADCGDDMDCQSSRSPLLYKAKKIQKLSAYGRGAEDDNALELGKAVGVDNGQEEQVITTNEPPTEDMIDEVNGAIAEQRGDRYTDGNSMPAKKIKLPKEAS